VHLPATAMLAVATAPVMTAPGVRAEDETAEEDDGDDEHAACHDADPHGDSGELAWPAVAHVLVLVLVWRKWRRRRRRRLGRRCGGDGAGRWFCGRGCFAHVPDDGRGFEVLVKNRL
jgi:hypothetical protein